MTKSLTTTLNNIDTIHEGLIRLKELRDLAPHDDIHLFKMKRYAHALQREAVDIIRLAEYYERLIQRQQA